MSVDMVVARPVPMAYVKIEVLHFGKNDGRHSVLRPIQTFRMCAPGAATAD